MSIAIDHVGIPAADPGASARPGRGIGTALIETIAMAQSRPPGNSGPRSFDAT